MTWSSRRHCASLLLSVHYNWWLLDLTCVTTSKCTFKLPVRRVEHPYLHSVSHLSHSCDHVTIHDLPISWQFTNIYWACIRVICIEHTYYMFVWPFGWVTPWGLDWTGQTGWTGLVDFQYPDVLRSSHSCGWHLLPVIVGLPSLRFAIVWNRRATGLESGEPNFPIFEGGKEGDTSLLSCTIYQLTGHI